MALFVDTLALIIIAVILFLIITAVSAFEPLFWWAGWSRRSSLDLLPDPRQTASGTGEDQRAQESPADSYLVYLSGAGSMDPAKMDEKEVYFLDLLEAHLPRSCLIRDVFPYSPTNNPLTGQRVLTRLWRYVWQARRVRRRNLLQRIGIHIAQFRNTLQVGVSADRRYGPLYSYGVAQVVAGSLLRHGYRVGSSAPVILLVLSGGGQIGVGCVPMLRRMLRRPIWVISIGSILTDDPGILEVEHLYHLSGSLDNTQYIGRFFYPGLWSIFPYSAPNLAKKQGKVTVIPMGPMKHQKQGDYMSRSALLPNGQRHVDKTVEVIAGLVAEIEARARANHAPNYAPTRIA